MKKRFKSKLVTQAPTRILKLVGIGFMLYLSFSMAFKFFYQKMIKPKMTNDTFVTYLLNSSFNHRLEGEDYFADLFNFNLKNPSFLLQYSMNHFVSKDDSTSVFEEVDADSDEEVKTDYVKDPHPIEVSKPVVYLYSTHQLENYDLSNLAPYNIKPNVLMASYVLREKLNDYGISTLVETEDISEVLRVHNWKYAASYQASRLLIQDAKEKHDSLKFFIDLHRDSSVRDRTTTTIEGKNYARVMFVVGKEHKDYEKNLKLANTLNDKIKAFNPALSRGVLGKEGPGVNGIYNQDVSPNSILIELGGQYNSIEEATNTIGVISKILATYIKENL